MLCKCPSEAAGWSRSIAKLLRGATTATIVATAFSNPVLAVIAHGNYEEYISEEYKLLTPAKSEYVRTEAADFLLEGGKSLKYYITYTLLKDIGPNPAIRVEFENPLGGEPLIYEKHLSSDERKLDIYSPEVPGIRNGGRYTVKLILFSDSKVVATHIDHPRFYGDPRLLEHLSVDILNRPKKEELEGLLSAYLASFDKRAYDKSARLFHYPNAFTGNELANEEKSLGQVLQYLAEEFGKIEIQKMEETFQGYIQVAGVETADDRYWYIHPYAPRLLYKATFGNGEEGLLGIMFCDVNDRWQIRGISYFLERTTPKAKEYEFKFNKMLYQLIKQSKNQ